MLEWVEEVEEVFEKVASETGEFAEGVEELCLLPGGDSKESLEEEKPLSMHPMGHPSSPSSPPSSSSPSISFSKTSISLSPFSLNSFMSNHSVFCPSFSM